MAFRIPATSRRACTQPLGQQLWRAVLYGLGSRRYNAAVLAVRLGECGWDDDTEASYRGSSSLVGARVRLSYRAFTPMMIIAESSNLPSDVNVALSSVERGVVANSNRFEEEGPLPKTRKGAALKK